LLELLAHELSADSFEDDLGAREDRWAQNVRRNLDAQLVAMRRRLAPARTTAPRVTRISAELQALDRAALLERLTTLRSGPEVRFAYLELTELTTDDLRLLVAELEATARTQEVPK
jgi:hypothetical protein